MVTWLRRLFWLAVLCGAGFAVWSAVQRRNEPPSPPPDPPRRPIDDLGRPSSPVATEPTPEPAPEPAPAPVSLVTNAVADEPQPPEAESRQRWVAPVDGACPAGFAIKVSAKSAVYHVPGGRFYERTTAERCYASTEDAEADGYRRAKA